MLPSPPTLWLIEENEESEGQASAEVGEWQEQLQMNVDCLHGVPNANPT